MTTIFFSLSASPMGIALLVCGLLLLVALVWAIAKRSGMKAAAGGKRATAGAGGPKAEEKMAVNERAEGPSPEVLAAITAAIMAVWEGERGFVVRRVKRVSQAPAWNRAGRDEQIYSRL